MLLFQTHYSNSYKKTCTRREFIVKKFYWGDIHNHNEIGYGAGSLARSYAIAMGCLLDFYAFTPHGHWPDAPDSNSTIRQYHEEGYRKVQKTWPEIVKATELYNVNNKFIAIPAFEWHSSKFGDYCVYLPGKEGATFPAHDLDSLRKFTRKHNALMIPHHIGYRPGARGLDWNNFNPVLSPVVEAFSEHGCSIESQTPYPMTRHSMGGLERSQTVFRQLNQGRFFGVIASSDNHHGHPASYGEGLTGIYTDSLTMESVFEALKHRHTIAVSGDRIEAFLRFDNAVIGDYADSANGAVFEYSALGFAEIEFLQIIKNGLPFFTEIPSGKPDESEFVFRIELGWGAMMEKNITDWKIEVNLQNGKFLRLSPGFCGGASCEKINRIVEFSPEQVLFEAFTSRKNTNSISSLTFHCHGDAAEIIVGSDCVHNGRHFRGTARVKTKDLNRRDSWIQHGDEFPSPVLKIGNYAPLNTFKMRGKWHDQEIKSGDWYMLKVQQKNGSSAWTSPIRIA